MAIFTDPIKEHADFGPGDAEWLHLLVGDWQLVADLAFADLALWFPHPELGLRGAGPRPALHDAHRVPLRLCGRRRSAATWPRW